MLRLIDRLAERVEEIRHDDVHILRIEDVSGNDIVVGGFKLDN